MRFLLAAIAALALISPAVANDDPFAGNARGSLHVRIELAGKARVNFPNGVEWAAIEAWRTLELDFGLVDVGNDGVPIVGGVPAGAVPPEAQALEAKIKACGDDQSCLAQTMMEFAQSGQGAEGGRNPFEAMLGMQPGRYRNFAADHYGSVCATGTLVVEDMLEGVTIPPPNPAVAYKFTRNGSLTLPAGDAYLMDYACRVEISLDTVAGTMSLRLPAAKLDVPVRLGPTAFTDETSVLLIEGAQTIELLDQPAGRDGAWSGVAELAELGSASHNAGQVVAPLKARIVWRFSEG
jgi:hypothetical protein